MKNYDLFKPLMYFYLGFSLGLFAKLTFTDWEFYAIILPIVLLDTFSDIKKNEE